MMKIIIECDTADEYEVAEGIRTLLEMNRSDWFMGFPMVAVLVDAPVGE